MKLKKLEIKQIAVSELKPNIYNPNKQDKKSFTLLCKSIEDDGFTQPIVALKDSLIIVDGEHRWRAAKKLGIEEIPVVIVEMSEADMRVSTLRHNQARGEEDADLAAEVMKSLKDAGAIEMAKDGLLMADKDVMSIMMGESNVLVEDVEIPESFISFKNTNTPKIVEAPPITREFQDSRNFVPDVNTGQRQKDFLAELNRKVYRIAVAFTGEDAAMVRKVLGNQPPIKMLELCRKYAEMFEDENDS